jgi:hypothetical protein
MAQVTEPVPFIEAFAREDEAALHSQAASLLLLGKQLEDDLFALDVRASMRGTEAPGLRLPPEDVKPLQVPTITATGERLPRERVRGLLSKDLAMEVEEVREGPIGLSDLASRLAERPDPRSAAELFEASLYHRSDLVRLAGAIGYLQVAADPSGLVEILVDGTRSEEPLVRDLASVALARFAPEHPRLPELTRPEATDEAEGASDSLIIHGTFARGNSWWQPGGDFHTYLRDNVRPDLYSDPDRYDWSGGYSDRARAAAAPELHDWVQEHNLAGLDLFTHSHGGSVAMLATHLGLRVGKLVLLSCPAHPNKYLPDFDQVDEVISIRVRLDLVILLDGGGQRFRHPRIRENRLPVWFNHSATHEPEVWEEHDVPSLL